MRFGSAANEDSLSWKARAEAAEKEADEAVSEYEKERSRAETAERERDQLRATCTRYGFRLAQARQFCEQYQHLSELAREVLAILDEEDE